LVRHLYGFGIAVERAEDNAETVHGFGHGGILVP
jgi:hypothetical protein